MSFSLTLYGVVPSKKNSWKRGRAGNVYIPEQVAADINALVIQAKTQRHRLPLASIAGSKLMVHAQFKAPAEIKDLDNMFTTILDVLQKAGVIKNDKLVRWFMVEERIEPGDPSVTIFVNTLSTGRNEKQGGKMIQ